MLYKEIEVIPNNSITSEGATLYAYVLDNTPQIDVNRVRPAVIVCPGGGYNHVSDREGEPVAMQFLAAGCQAFVLRYHIAPVEFPQQLKELATAVKIVREHATEWHIDPEQVIIAGFSAGGHLAASLAVNWKKEWLCNELNLTSEEIRPNACLLSYPVITSGEFAHRGSFEKLIKSNYNEEYLEKLSLEKQVNVDVPPTFIWHTYSDAAVPVENSLLYIAALRKFGIPVEFHMYPEGSHGLSLANEETKGSDGKGVQVECQTWIELAKNWIHWLGGREC